MFQLKVKPKRSTKRATKGRRLSPLVGVLHQELIDQVAFRPHHLHTIVPAVSSQHRAPSKPHARRTARSTASPHQKRTAQLARHVTTPTYSGNTSRNGHHRYSRPTLHARVWRNSSRRTGYTLLCSNGTAQKSFRTLTEQTTFNRQGGDTHTHTHTGPHRTMRSQHSRCQEEPIVQ